MEIRSHRRAFTLIELLVVIAIIAVLIGLLVPAVQKVREAAARTQCENNLKQMCLALHSYADTNKHFPPAIKTTVANTPGWGWGALILPFIEQGALYKSAGVATEPFGQVNGKWGTGGSIGGPCPANFDFYAIANSFTQTVLPIYRCPSDQGPDLNPAKLNFATSNYRAIMGAISAVADPRWSYCGAYDSAGQLRLTSVQPCAAGSFAIGYGAYYPGLDFHGVMFENSRIRFTDITDGTSNTLAVGECVLSTVPPAGETWDNPLATKTAWTPRYASIWAGFTGLHVHLSATPIGTVCGAYISDNMWWMDENSATVNGPVAQAFSSNHGGGAYFGFCDGSVRWFPEGLSPQIAMMLAGRNDGYVVNYDF